MPSAWTMLGALELSCKNLVESYFASANRGQLLLADPIMLDEPPEH